ncbi:hypothetical protein L3Q65_00320 (plasmid) [Amycolatopsis sp. FU40]|uniref:hypothetical protein n=1 Tax=Amycolatopsis sp. FU40 TaxID=2914159 RepID=UPI001F30E0D0|nr:hypothetical protein [Amycolatopsis sp. FU40]UKD50774.1 hypothetical protein L3Q65_00320 [Amycolatopsis sp. FU40]
MDKADIEKALETHGGNDSWEFWDDLRFDCSSSGIRAVSVVEGLGRVEVLEYTREDAREGGCRLVLRVGERYFAKHGYYSSFEGSNVWDGLFREVSPVTKTVYE